MEELVKGQWRVALKGYEWTETAHNDRRLVATAGLLEWRVYAPFQEEPLLFVRLSEVDPTDEGILKFANRYGLLVASAVVLQDGKVSTGDDFKTWQTAIVTTRHALNVWNALKQGDRKKIERWFTLKDQGKYIDVVYSPDEEWPLGVGRWSTQFLKEELAWIWRFGDEGEPDDAAIPRNSTDAALEWLRRNVREHLRAHAAASFHYLPKSKNLVPLGLSIVPKNLLGAIWLQFAHSIEGNIRYQRCLQCQRFFKVSNKALRETTAYCSTNCRVKYNRAGKKGRELAAKGKSIAAIAKEMSVDAETVKKWLEKKKGREPGRKSRAKQGRVQRRKGGEMK